MTSKDHYDWLMSQNEPEKKIAKQDEVFKIETERIFTEVRKPAMEATE